MGKITAIPVIVPDVTPDEINTVFIFIRIYGCFNFSKNVLGFCLFWFGFVVVNINVWYANKYIHEYV